jgi:membrane associated rhomboid family serine protease
MIPISDSVKSKKFPILNLLIIGINIYVFIQMLLSGNIDAFIGNFALIPANIDFSNISTLYPFITHMFLHGGFFHIISNMLFLWVFGDNIEGHYGRLWYLIIYFISGIAGALLQFIFSPHSMIPMLGASGAISGILGAYYISHPHSKIKSLFPIFFFITFIEIPSGLYIIYWFVLQLFSGITSLGSITDQTGGVAVWAHIGGFIAGVLLAKILPEQNNDGIIEGEIVG